VEIRRLKTRKKNCEPGEGFVKICLVKKRVGEGGESESALDDAFGIRVTERSCCEKLFEKRYGKKTLETTLKFSDCPETI